MLIHHLTDGLGVSIGTPINKIEYKGPVPLRSTFYFYFYKDTVLIQSVLREVPNGVKVFTYYYIRIRTYSR